MEALGIVDREFWRGKKVLVTGHTGFKGAWLTLWLESLGADVSGISLGVPTNPSMHATLAASSTVTSLECDIRECEKLVPLIESQRPEIVFHLAAQSLVRPSYEDPTGTFATNVMGTVHVLEAARRTPSVRALINVTSDKCYENREWGYAYRENDSMGGRDPYSASKGCAELVTAAYRQSFLSDNRVGVASVRAGNVIGGGDWSTDRLIPDCVRAFAQGEAALIRNPASVRPWQHVLEAARGYLILGQLLYHRPADFSVPFNFGPDSQDAQPVSQVVEQLRRGWGDPASVRIQEEGAASAPHEARFLRLDSSLSRVRLGWKPLLPLSGALAWTVEWYRAFYQGVEMRKISMEQIARMEMMERGNS